MNKRNQIYRIMNYCPWPGVFSLLEIVIFVAGILAAVLFFRFTSELKETNDLIHHTNLIPSLGVASTFFAVSLILWRNRRVHQSQTNLLETEKEQRLRFSAALDNEQIKLSTVLTYLPDPVFLLDIHSYILDANPAAAHLLGYSNPESLRGKNNADFAPPELENEILEINQRILKTGNPLTKEATILNELTGKWQNLLITKTPFYDRHEQIAGLILIGQNITAKKQAENELHLTNQKLKEGIAELEQRTREMDLFTQMLDLLSACPCTEEAYKIIEDQLGKMNLADSGMLYMINSSRNNLQQVAVWGQSASDPVVFPPGDCWGWRRGKLHIVAFNPATHHDDQHDNPLICRHMSSTAPADHLCLPLVAQGETLGILHLLHFVDTKSIGSAEVSKCWFTPQRVQRINILAGSLALAIANLELRSTLRQQSIRDPLTGLFNRRYMEETLERELLRASRNGKNVGLMMIDIDHFKRFNDTYGHPAADAVLSAVANFLSSSVRREDLVCRYGGEEILIMLPETELEMTHQRAEDICKGVARLNLQHQGCVLEHVNVSIGVGTSPAHGQTPEALIHSVDQALYRAKNNGRNRVEVATPSVVEPRYDSWQRFQSRIKDGRISRSVVIQQ